MEREDIHKNTINVESSRTALISPTDQEGRGGQHGLGPHRNYQLQTIANEPLTVTIAIKRQ